MEACSVQPDADPARPRPARLRGFWLLVLLSFPLLGFLAYRGSLDVPFLWDDQIAIVANPRLEHLWPFGDAGYSVQSPECGRPVVRFSLALNHVLGLGGPLDPRGYHLVNLALHVGSALLLCFVLHATLARAPGWRGAAPFLAAAIAALWLVHPLQSEAVTYVIQRTELLMAFFCLATLAASIRTLTSSHPRRWAALGIACCALGMASKEVMAVAPILVAAYDRAFVFPSWRSAWRRRKCLYAGLAATWIVLALLVSTGPRNASVGFDLGVAWWQYGRTQLGLILHYLRLAFWPTELCLDYGIALADTGVAVVPGAIVVGLLAAASLWAWFRRPALGYLGVWFFLLLAPSSSVVPILTEVGAERRMYLPLAALLAAVVLSVWVLARRAFGRWPRIAAAALGVCVSIALVALTLTTVRRVAVYSSALSIWHDAAEKRPGNPRAHNSLGREYMLANRPAEALAEFTAALALPGCEDEAFTNAGHALTRLGRTDEAGRYFEELLAVDPEDCSAHEGLGAVRVEQGRWAEARTELERCVALGCGSANIENNLGKALFYLGLPDEAMRAFEIALQLEPGHGPAAANLERVRSLQQSGPPAR